MFTVMFLSLLYSHHVSEWMWLREKVREGVSTCGESVSKWS